MNRPCIKCDKKAVSRSKKYGVTLCSESCLASYSFQRTSTSLTTLLPLHGSLLRQAFIERAFNRFEESNYNLILKELGEIDSFIAKLVYNRSGKDIGVLLDRHVKQCINKNYNVTTNGNAIINALLPDGGDEYDALTSHMEKYQNAIVSLSYQVMKQINHDDLASTVCIALTALAEGIDHILVKEAKVEPTFTFMMNHMSGRTPTFMMNHMSGRIPSFTSGMTYSFGNTK